MSEICLANPYDASRYFQEKEIEALSGCISRCYLMTLKRPGSSYEREIFFRYCRCSERLYWSYDSLGMSDDTASHLV